MELAQKELENSDASVHLIMSGIPFHSPKIPASEEWSDYQGDYDKLMKIVEELNPKGPTFLSGDKHFSSGLYSKREIGTYVQRHDS